MEKHHNFTIKQPSKLVNKSARCYAHFAEIISNNYYTVEWSKIKDNSDNYEAHLNAYGASTSKNIFSYCELQDLHPKLPELVDYADKKGDSLALKLWWNHQVTQSLHVTNSEDSQEETDGFFIFSFSNFEITSTGQILFAGAAYEFKEPLFYAGDVNNSLLIPCACTKVLYFKMHDFEQSFPGFEKRLRLSETLDLTGEALTSYALNLISRGGELSLPVDLPCNIAENTPS